MSQFLSKLVGCRQREFDFAATSFGFNLGEHKTIATATEAISRKTFVLHDLDA